MTAEEALATILTTPDTVLHTQDLADRWKAEGLLAVNQSREWLFSIDGALRRVRPTDTNNQSESRLGHALNARDITRAQRWRLLKETILEPTGSAENPNLMMVRRAILCEDLELAFVSRTRLRVEVESIKADITDRAWWSSDFELQPSDFTGNLSPFFQAARDGALTFVQEAVEMLIQRLQARSENMQRSLFSVLSLGTNYQALDYAVDSERHSIVEYLLKKSPDLADPLMLQNLVNHDRLDQKMRLVELFVKILKEKKPWEFWVKPLTGAIARRDVGMAQTFNKISPKVFNGTHAKQIIELDQCAQWWPDFESNVGAYVEAFDLLSLAIKKRRVSVVKSLIRTHAHLLFRPDKTRKLPLCQNRGDNCPEDKAARKEIRELVVAAIISRSHDDTFRIRDILSQCKGKFR
jgi:hypothetical protein